MRMISVKQKMIFLPEIKVFHNYIPAVRNKSWRERFLRNSMRNEGVHYITALSGFFDSNLYSWEVCEQSFI